MAEKQLYKAGLMLRPRGYGAGDVIELHIDPDDVPETLHTPRSSLGDIYAADFRLVGVDHDTRTLDYEIIDTPAQE